MGAFHLEVRQMKIYIGVFVEEHIIFTIKKLRENILIYYRDVLMSMMIQGRHQKICWMILGLRLIILNRELIMKKKDNSKQELWEAILLLRKLITQYASSRKTKKIKLQLRIKLKERIKRKQNKQIYTCRVKAYKDRESK